MMTFDDWYAKLRALAYAHGESVADVSAWRESYDDGETVEHAFYGEYPEHQPQ